MAREKSNPSDEFKAHKLAVQKRLEREGRWAEANQYKETVRKTLVDEKKAGRLKMTADEIVAQSWAEMEKAFPPLSAEEIERNKEATGGNTEATSVNNPPASSNSVAPVVVPVQKPNTEPQKRERATFVVLPQHWGDLPDKAKFEDEIDWVYQNYVFATERKSTGCTMRLSRCRTPAPSMGAVALLEWAIENRTAFFKDVLPKAKKGVEDEDADTIRTERKSIAEIERILDQMLEVQT